MSDQTREALDRLTDAILDGSHIDWDRERFEHAEIGATLEQLRRLESIANAYRSPLLAANERPGDPAVRSPEVGPSREPDRPEPRLPLGDASPAAVFDASTLSQSELSAATSPGGAAFPITWGPLRILEQLGAGAHGEVFRAYDPTLQREVALKLLRAEAASERDTSRRMLAEARRMARVRHPNVLAVHGVAEHDGRPGIWTELVRGRTLLQVLTEQGPLSAPEAALVGVELCRALAALHVAGLVHRDVKPSNVMREHGGRLVLMDLGSSAELLHAQGSRREVEGTPILMAPEVLLHGATPTPETDIYSVGVLLYWCVSGRYPVEASELRGLREKHLRGDVRPLRDLRPDLPTAFVQVVERALRADPAQRYASAGEMETDLARCVGVSAASAPGISTDLSERQHQHATSISSVEGARGRPSWWRDRGARRRRALLTIASAATVAIVGWVIATRWLAPLRVDVALYRRGPSGEELLLPGSTIRPGDRLFLQIEGSRRMHAYVLEEDPKRDVEVLFPDDSRTGNPLSGGVRHRLPGGSGARPRYWEVSGALGEETILVIVSRDPSPEIERRLASFARPEVGGRGLKRLVEGDETTLEELSRTAETRGFWVRKIQLHNLGS